MDLLGLIVRPNKKQIARPIYDAKVKKWLAEWPNLRVVPWDAGPMAEESVKLARLAKRYRRFATDEAQGVSPHYERLARDIADSADILRFLSDLPAPRRQPNLLLGAATLIAGRPPDIAVLTDMVRNRADELRATMLGRTTQTNEPARCAVLLPLLAALPQPLALIEVGASAGLCCCPTATATIGATLALRPPIPARLCSAVP